jgi:hypothetical protein
MGMCYVDDPWPFFLFPPLAVVDCLMVKFFVAQMMMANKASDAVQPTQSRLDEQL